MNLSVQSIEECSLQCFPNYMIDQVRPLRKLQSLAMDTSLRFSHHVFYMEKGQGVLVWEPRNLPLASVLPSVMGNTQPHGASVSLSVI